MPCASTTTTSALVVLLALLVLLLVCEEWAGGGVPLHLVEDGLGNEALVVEGDFAGGGRRLFMLDTAYAGAPVLSTTYLAQTAASATRGRGVGARYRAVVDDLRHVTREARLAALEALLRGGRCRSFTSGCTMRLMGIQDTAEAQADMLLCPALGLRGARARDGDVFVTNPLPRSVHILTSDYLLHRAPCVLRPKAGRLHFGAHAGGFDFLPQPRMVGGAFAVPMTVGGVELSIVVDTGAAAALTLGRDAAARVALARTGRRATQAGVNGERVCSEAHTAEVALGRWLRFPDVEVFANASGNVQGADGYAGMGLLRAVDLYLAPGVVGVRASGLRPRASRATVEGGCA
jgi:predicted aspartyl protease